VVEASADLLYVDCSARGVERRPAIPIFAGQKITPQMVRALQPTFSGAFIAHVEASIDGEAKKNKLCTPIPMSDAPQDWLSIDADESGQPGPLEARFPGQGLDPALQARPVLRFGTRRHAGRHRQDRTSVTVRPRGRVRSSKPATPNSARGRRGLPVSRSFTDSKAASSGLRVESMLHLRLATPTKVLRRLLRLLRPEARWEATPATRSRHWPGGRQYRVQHLQTFGDPERSVSRHRRTVGPGRAVVSPWYLVGHCSLNVYLTVRAVASIRGSERPFSFVRCSRRLKLLCLPRVFGAELFDCWLQPSERVVGGCRGRWSRARRCRR